MSENENSILENLSPMKKEIIQELMQSADNTTPEKALPLLLKANARLKKAGEHFTKEETAFLVTEVTKQLSPQEKAKLSTIMRML